MDDLQDFYRRALSGRIVELRAALQSLGSDPDEGREALRRIAHSLRGSGATYGFPQVTAAAAAAEEAPDNELDAQTESLIAVLEEIAAPQSSRPVLIVDDDPEMQLLLRALVSAAGRETVVAASAAEAKARVASDAFDLILLDLLLPDADGREVLRAVRGSGANTATPLFVLSGKGGEAVHAECLALGADDVFAKPFDPARMGERIAAQLRTARADAPAGAAQGRAILVVEDDELVASILKHRLAREGFQVVHFSDGASALDALPAQRIALAILDVKVPGVDGFELLSRLRAERATARVPVIMLTAMGTEHDVVRGLELGANDYIVKPFSPVELIARVHRLLPS